MVFADDADAAAGAVAGVDDNVNDGAADAVEGVVADAGTDDDATAVVSMGRLPALDTGVGAGMGGKGLRIVRVTVCALLCSVFWLPSRIRQHAISIRLYALAQIVVCRRLQAACGARARTGRCDRCAKRGIQFASRSTGFRAAHCAHQNEPGVHRRRAGSRAALI